MAHTFLTLQEEVAGVLKMDLNKSAEAKRVKRWINDTEQDIHGRHDWYWTKDREVVQTVVDKTAGTVAVAAGGIVVTGTSTAFASDDAGKFIQLSGSADWYKIASVTNSTSLTLEAPYTQTSALSGGTYTIRKVFYPLSTNAEKILDLRQTISPRRLVPVPSKDFHTRRPDGTATGKGRIYIPWNLDSSDRIQFSVYPWPDEIFNLEFSVKKHLTEMVNNTDTPKIPPKWRPS